MHSAREMFRSFQFAFHEGFVDHHFGFPGNPPRQALRNLLPGAGFKVRCVVESATATTIRITADLYRLAECLASCGVKTVAMQSTGVYWIPLYEILEEHGFEVYLVNARHTKNLPGRKSDVQENQ